MSEFLFVHNVHNVVKTNGAKHFVATSREDEESNASKEFIEDRSGNSTQKQPLQHVSSPSKSLLIDVNAVAAAAAATTTTTTTASDSAAANAAHAQPNAHRSQSDTSECTQKMSAHQTTSTEETDNAHSTPPSTYLKQFLRDYEEKLNQMRQEMKQSLCTKIDEQYDAIWKAIQECVAKRNLVARATEFDQLEPQRDALKSDYDTLRGELANLQLALDQNLANKGYMR